MTPSKLLESAEATFDEFAVFYDSFTAHHDYERWTSALEALALEHGLAGHRLLDLACGTGKSFLPMLDRRYAVTACDLSPGMLQRAREKADGRVEFAQCDMRALPELGSFDLVTCLDDAVNYLLSPEDLAAAFSEAAGCLAPGGIYLFDANTLHTFRSIFANDDCHEAEGWFFVWRGESPSDLEAGSIGRSTIEAFRANADGTWRRISNRHRQRHHTEGAIRAALDRAGLDLAGVYGHGQDGIPEAEVDETRHTKAIYVARRPA